MKKQFSRMMMVAAVAACTLFSVSSFAQQQKQPKQTPEERAKRMTDSMKTNLSLTDDQYNKVYDLNVNYITKMQALRQQQGSREDKMQQFKELRKSEDNDLGAVLTKDQMEKYKAMQKEKWQDRKNHQQKPKESSQS